MSLIKKATELIVLEYKKPPHCGHKDWETHPSLIAGIEALESYNRWVSEVVLPIAFQWIEEHKADVYANVEDSMKDDVGVVIASAFDLVKDMSAYQKGLARFEEYKAAMDAGTWDSEGINPVWSGITHKVRKETKASFEKEARFLKDTIR